MIRQVTATKTHFKAGSGQEAAEGRETGHCSHTRIKASLSTAAGRAAKSHRFLCLFPHGIQAGKEGCMRLSALLHEQGW